jgi:type II secretory pathway component PulM
VFRTPKIPAHLDLKDIITVKGYFLQRFNFLNRMNRATWAPLLVATSVEKVKEQEYGLTPVEQRWIFSILALLILGFIWLVMRKPKNKKRLVVKKVLKPSKK